MAAIIKVKGEKDIELDFDLLQGPMPGDILHLQCGGERKTPTGTFLVQRREVTVWLIGWGAPTYGGDTRGVVLHCKRVKTKKKRG